MSQYFKQFLLESNIEKYRKSADLIVSYLKKHISGLKEYPGVEQFSGEDSGFGLRFFFGKKSLRINYKSSTVSSIDLWSSGKYDADYRILLTNVSIVTALPTILSIINSPKSGEIELKEETENSIKVQNAPKTTVVSSKHIEELDKKTNLEDQLNDLEKLLTGVIKRGLANCCIISGKGGLGKTFTVEKIIKSCGLEEGSGYAKVAGSATASAVYKKLFDNRTGIILFDDCDSALDTQEGRNIFKAATDTKKIRRISWEKNASFIYNPDKLFEVKTSKQIEKEIAKIDSMKPKFSIEKDSLIKEPIKKDRATLEKQAQEKGLYPNRFDFEGKIVFISNLSLDELDPDGALRTRAFIIELTPTTDDILGVMRKIVDNITLEPGLSLSNKDRLEVVDVLAKYPKVLNMRKLQRGLNLRASGFDDWEDLLIRYG